jgi:hypothetical protein
MGSNPIAGKFGGHWHLRSRSQVYRALEYWGALPLSSLDAVIDLLAKVKAYQ